MVPNMLEERDVFVRLVPQEHLGKACFLDMWTAASLALFIFSCEEPLMLCCPVFSRFLFFVTRVI